MKTKSTYSLLLNAEAEDKSRSIFETAVYSFVVLATAVSMWAFASGAVVTPGMNRVDRSAAAEAPAPQPIVLASR